MSHDVLFGVLRDHHVPDDPESVVGNYVTLLGRRTRGIVAGGALSPLIGAIYLMPLGQVMDRLAASGDILYVRYMDDYVVLAKTRMKLKRTIAKMHKALLQLGIEVHREKRFIGYTKRGIDFLGHSFRAGRKLRPSPESLPDFARA